VTVSMQYHNLCIDIDYSDLKELGRTGEKVPAIGLGTWGIGGFFEPDHSKDEIWIKIVKKAIELGMWLIDTAEMYGGGHSEEVVGQAISQFDREHIFIITKVRPEKLLKHVDVFSALLKEVKSSLCRLNVKYIDLYLLHWPPRRELGTIMRGMERLVNLGYVRYIGVSNFNIKFLAEARESLSFTDIVADEVEYNLLNRTIEINLLPYAQKEGITIIAYRPLARGELAKNRFLACIGQKYNKTSAQVALNWLICNKRVIAIPKTENEDHLAENANAMGWRLSVSDFLYISTVFH